MREYSKVTYKDPDKKEAKIAAAKRKYHKNKKQIAAVRAEQRMMKFMQKTEKERFLDFHEEMKNVCGFGTPTYLILAILYHSGSNHLS